MMRLFAIYLFSSMCLGLSEFPASLISNLFSEKNVYSVAIISCASKEDKIHAMKQMVKTGIQVSFSTESLYSRDSYRIGGVLDLRCNNTKDLISKITESRLSLTHHEWVFLDETEDTGEEEKHQTPTTTVNLEQINNMYLLPGSSVTLIQLSGSKAHYYDVYRVSLMKPIKYHNIATFSRDSDEHLPPRSDRSNLERIVLNTATVIYKWDLFTTLEDLSRVDVDAWAKIHYPVLKHLEEQLNFKMNLTISDDYGWDVNGTFNGIMGYFQRGEAELGGTGMFMRADRMRLVDFTNVCFDLGATVIFKQPRLSSVCNIFIRPFSRQVWMAIGILALAIIVFLGLELFVNKKRSAHMSYNDEHTTIVDIVTFVTGFICQQGSHITPESLASRIAVFTFSLSVVFFYTSFSASIVALLRSTPNILKTLTDLTESQLNVIVEDRKYNIIYFKESTDPAVQALYEHKVKPHLETAFVPPKDGVAKMRTGEFAYNVDINAGYKWISDTFEEAEKCSLSEIKLFKTEALAIPVAKKSGYKEIVAQKLCWQRENGLLAKITATWIPPKPQCSGESGGFTSVGITDFLPAILVLVYGCSVATFVLILEYLINHRSLLYDSLRGFQCTSQISSEKRKNAKKIKTTNKI